MWIGDAEVAHADYVLLSALRHQEERNCARGLSTINPMKPSSQRGFLSSLASSVLRVSEPSRYRYHRSCFGKQTSDLLLKNNTKAVRASARLTDSTANHVLFVNGVQGNAQGWVGSEKVTACACLRG